MAHRSGGQAGGCGRLWFAVNGGPSGSGGYAAGGWIATVAGVAMVVFGLRRVLQGSRS